MFLADGTAEGLRLVEKSNWNGMAITCSRAQYPQVREREEFSRPGVYLLSGPSSLGSGRQSVYIGQADVARSRLDNHHRTREWTQLILFVSRDTSLNKAHVQYLEARLIEMASKARRVDVENANAPRITFLSEADQADADAFLDDMLLIYPVLGVTAFEVVAPVASADTLVSNELLDLLYLKALLTDARGRYTPEGFIVLTGSQARLNPVESLQATYRDLRESLLEKGVLVERDGFLEFTQDYRFDSPTQAACVLTGRSASGWVEWQDHRGRTLRKLESLAVPRNSLEESDSDLPGD